MVLHSEKLAAPGASPTRAVLFLHGILGSGGNLRGQARPLVEARSDLLAILVDLRAHGQSLGEDGPDTLESAAADLVHTARTWPVPVEAVVGHSFGGKVALAFARTCPDVGAVMTLDSVPGRRLPGKRSETALEVLALLASMPGPWATRAAFVAQIEQHGFSRGLAQWLAMNLAQRPEGLVFRLALPRIRALIDDYYQVDLWPVVEAAARSREGPRVHLVIGSRSTMYASEDRERALALEAEGGGRVTVDVLDSGHWVHVDNPLGLSQVLLKRLV